MNRLDEFMAEVMVEGNGALDRLEKSMSDGEIEIRKISDGIRKLVHQGFLSLAYRYVASIDNCPRDVMDCFYKLAKKQADYDHLVLEQQIDYTHVPLEGVW